jgi:HD-like signal output (HDOD) protein
VRYSELGNLIEKDTVLAGYILRLVNSALYGCRGTVSSVRHAVSMIGLVKLRNVVLSLSISRMWHHVRTPPSWSAARFNLHSVAVATMADLIVQRADVEDAEGAFVGGLLHDIGKLLIAIGLAAEYEEIHDLYKKGGRSWSDCEREILGLTHANLSEAALSRWNLPDSIQKAVLFHHEPFIRSEDSLDLASALNLADRVVNELDICCTDLVERHQPDPAGLLVEAGFGDYAERILEEFETEFAAMRQYF